MRNKSIFLLNGLCIFALYILSGALFKREMVVYGIGILAITLIDFIWMVRCILRREVVVENEF